ncbi:MAG: hypothetical protein DMD31_17845, partial [Gemmatimonadetes bacterium]
GFVVGKASFDVVLATTDITTGNPSLGTLLDASLLSVTLSDLSLFAGAGAHLIVPADPANIAGYGIDTSDALGFSIAGGEVKLAIVKPGELAEGDRTSYTGLEIGFSGAQLEGVSPDLVFRASGTVLINKATGATGLEAPNRIDWAAATNDTNDPAHLIPAFSSNLTAGMKLRIEGAAALDIFGAVLGTASFSLTQATETIDTGNPDIGTLTDASVLAISLSNVNLFAGAGASLTVPADPANVAGYGINTTGALGFAVTGGAVDLAIVRPSGAAADQYIGLQASLAGASLVGVDGLRFIASGTVLVNKTTAASNEKINWATATGEILPEFNPLLGADTDLAIIDGHASLDLFGFVVGMADFSILQGTTTVHTGNPAIGASGTLTDASVMVVTLSNLNLFAGAGAALNDNGTPADTSDDAIDRNGAIGFDISGGMVTLDVVRPAASGASYTGLSVGASGSLGGIPGLTLSVTGTILVNKATGAAPTQRIDWATVTDTNHFLPQIPGLTRTVELAISGSAAIDLFGVVVGTAGFGFASRTVDVDQNANGVFSLTERDLDDATLLTIDLTIGFEVSGGHIALAIIRANPNSIAGDNRSYVATTSSLDDAEFIGLPSGLQIHASDIAVQINRASGVVPLSSPAAAPAPLDWTKAIDLDGDHHFGHANGDDVMVGSALIDLSGDFTGIRGKLRLDAFDVLRAYAAFDMVIRTVDVNLDGNATITAATDLDDAQLMTIGLALMPLDPALNPELLPAGLSGVQPGLFIGVPGGVGFAVNSGQLTFATIKPNADPAKSPSGFDRTYTALSASLRGVGLTGLPAGVIIEATRLEFASNSSTGTYGSLAALDWTHTIDLQAGDAAFDADAIVVGGRTLSLTTGGFTIGGALKIDLQGFVLAAGAFQYQQLTGQAINDGAGISATGVTLQTIDLTGLQLFVGVNGAFVTDSDGNVTGLNTSAATGFSVSGASLDIAIASETSGALRSWMGLAAHVGLMSVHGLPAGFELQVLSLDLRYNAPDDASGTRLNWAGVSQVASTLVAQITGSTQLAVSGRLYLNVSGFVVAAAAFDLSEVSGVPVNDGQGINLPLASILLLHLSDVFLFIGIGGVLSSSGYTGTPAQRAAAFEADLEAAGAIGFFVADASLDLGVVGNGT